jgi:hypothetical protein
MNSVISGPVPPYSNPPIEPQFYQPRRFEISAVTLGVTTTVTTIDDMDYVIGQLVKLLIPPFYGCRQLNEQEGYVISIPAPNQVVVEINSSQNVDPFVSANIGTPPQIIAVGDINSGIISSTGRNIPTTNIPGSFINISPN